MEWEGRSPGGMQYAPNRKTHSRCKRRPAVREGTTNKPSQGRQEKGFPGSIHDRARVPPGRSAVHAPTSRFLPHNPADGVVLQLDVLRIPKIAEHMAGRHVADAALAVIVGPAARSRGAVALISETFFVHGLEEKELGVLVVSHVVLLVGDYEILDALRDGVIGIRHLHFEGPDGRMSGVGRAQDVAEVRVGQADMGGIVQEKRGAACIHKLAHGLALLGLHPKLRLRSLCGKGGSKTSFGFPVATQAALVLSSPP